MNINVILEELKVFNSIKFDKETHKYSIDDYIFDTSVTTWLKQFTEEFKKDFWAEYKAKEKGVSKESILSEWKEIARVATDDIGSPFHEYIQSLFDLNHKYELPQIKNPELEKLIILADDFKSKASANLIHIASEIAVGSIELNVVGTFDQLFFNKKDNCVELWDWKTSKKIELESYNNKTMKHPFNRCIDANFYHYSLQLNIYKYIIEKYTNIKIGNCRIANFNYINNEYKIYKCVNLQNQINQHFNEIN